ncbi:MAG: O-antigen ligase family protein [Capsulimonadaceae bacterium]|nr:O-antigen ligase family protein [Capsulimonadaceae bacterium]
MRETYAKHTVVDITAEELARAARLREMKLVGAACFFALLLGGLYILGGDNFGAPLLVATGIALTSAAWYFPRSAPAITLGLACLFELTISLDFKMPRTDQFPIFWDWNTVVQRYMNVPSFHAMPFSPFEVFIALSVSSFLIRGIVFHDLRVKHDGLVWLFFGFLACVALSLVVGMATGGAFNKAMFEIRPLAYLVLAYLLSTNMTTDTDAQTRRLLWVTALCVGFKAAQAAIRYVVEQHGSTIPEIGIGTHEESFFFDAFALMLVVLWLTGAEPGLRWLMTLFFPVVLWMNAANQRRAATAAFLIVIPMLLALAYAALPMRRRMIRIVSILIVVVSAIYFPAFWNKTGTLAQPARAVKSQISPDDRDLSSNAYRDAENANLFETMMTSPVVGYGYGKPFIMFTNMVDLSSVDPLIRFIPHNSVLWVWMRTGTIGFTVFWVLFAAIIIASAQTCRDPRFTSTDKLVGMYVGCLAVMQLIFGLLDMQLGCCRNMLFTGTWVGLLTAVRINALRRQSVKEPPEPEFRPQPTQWRGWSDQRARQLRGNG